MSTIMGSALSRMHGAALPAAPRVQVAVERLEQRRQVTDDALQLHLDAMNQRVAIRAEPLEAVAHALGAGTLDDDAETPGLGPLRRVAAVARQQGHRPTVQPEVPPGAR